MPQRCFFVGEPSNQVGEVLCAVSGKEGAVLMERYGDAEHRGAAQLGLDDLGVIEIVFTDLEGASVQRFHIRRALVGGEACESFAEFLGEIAGAGFTEIRQGPHRILQGQRVVELHMERLTGGAVGIKKFAGDVAI